MRKKFRLKKTEKNVLKQFGVKKTEKVRVKNPLDLGSVLHGLSVEPRSKN